MNLAVLQARTSSTRLPGKVLRSLSGTPMILRIVDRVRRASMLDELVVATSTDPSDDALVDVLEGAGVLVRRGPLDDVLARFLLVVRELEPANVVRLTGDNALTDPAVIDLAVRAHLESAADYTSNAIIRTFPRGLDVEVVSSDALRRLQQMSPDAEEREHVTLGIHRRPESFSIRHVTQSPDYSDLRWTVDTPADFCFAERIHTLLRDTPEFGQKEVLELLRGDSGLRRTEQDARSEA